MKEFLSFLGYFLGYFIIYFSIYEIYYIYMVKKKKDLPMSVEMTYLVNRYHIHFKHISYRSLLRILNMVNSALFSLALIFISSSIIDSMIVSILIVFILMLPTIYFVYDIIGKRFGEK